VISYSQQNNDGSQAADQIALAEPICSGVEWDVRQPDLTNDSVIGLKSPEDAQRAGRIKLHDANEKNICSRRTNCYTQPSLYKISDRTHFFDIRIFFKHNARRKIAEKHINDSTESIKYAAISYGNLGSTSQRGKSLHRVAFSR
jgi:hypothetical protein